MIDGQRLLLLTVDIKRVAIQATVVVIVRILVGQLLHLADGCLLVAFLRKQATLGKRQALRLTLQGLQTVQRTDGIVVVLLLFIKLYQHT